MVTSARIGGWGRRITRMNMLITPNCCDRACCCFFVFVVPSRPYSRRKLIRIDGEDHIYQTVFSVHGGTNAIAPHCTAYNHYDTIWTQTHCFLSLCSAHWKKKSSSIFASVSSITDPWAVNHYRGNQYERYIDNSNTNQITDYYSLFSLPHPCNAVNWMLTRAFGAHQSNCNNTQSLLSINRIMRTYFLFILYTKFHSRCMQYATKRKCFFYFLFSFYSYFPLQWEISRRVFLVNWFAYVSLVQFKKLSLFFHTLSDRIRISAELMKCYVR